MKKLTLLIICSWFSMLYTYSQDVIYKPEGALLQSLRNDGKSELYIPGCGNALKMDDMNNLYGDYWSFYLVGTVESLSDITVKPYCPASKIGLRKGCGYVGYCSRDDYNRGIYIRFYVTEMVTSTSNEIIGATLLYQTNYQSKDEMERATQARAEREASKIFWNGNAVPDAELRKILLDKFDTDHDGKISQTEAMKRTSVEINDKKVKSLEGINNLTGLTTILLSKNVSSIDNIEITLPNLKRFTILDCNFDESSFDLTGCESIDSVELGNSSINKLILRNCTKLRSINSTPYYDSKHYYYTKVNQLDVVGCINLKTINGNNSFLYGSFLNASDCITLERAIGNFQEINLSNCANLKEVTRVRDKGEYKLKKLNLEGCNNLETIDFQYSSDCEISELNLRCCKNLRHIGLCSTTLTFLDLSQCKRLRYIAISGNKLSMLDLSHCKELKSLRIDRLLTETLNLEQLNHLQNLECLRTRLTALNLSDCDSLRSIYIYQNKNLKSLNLSNCKLLENVYCEENNNLKSFVSSNWSFLRDIKVSGSNNIAFNCKYGLVKLENNQNFQLTIEPNEIAVYGTLLELNLSELDKFKHIRLFIDEIENIDLSNLKHLESVTCSGKKLKEINLSGCDRVETIWCGNNKNLESINLTGCSSLSTLFCEENPSLTTLDISTCYSLTSLDCEGNIRLTKLDVTNNHQLNWIRCCNTSIRELDISHSKTTMWDNSLPDVGESAIPSATEGFKTLWVNKNQKINENLFLKDLKGKDKALLLKHKLNDNSEEIDFIPADFNFKIKVR